MMAYWNDISFANKELLYLLLLIPLLGLWYFFKYQKNTPTLTLASTTFITGKKTLKTKLLFLPKILQLTGIALLIIALARPQSASSWQDVRSEGIDIVLGMDISTSMLAQDLSPDRLRASKKLAIDFIEKRPNDRIGLVVFAGESFTQCPLTTDHDVLKNLFKGIKSGIIEDGTAIGSGLATAINRLKDSEAKSKVIILLTDGSNTVKSIPPTTAAEIAQKFDIRIYTIGVGTNGLAPYPFKMYGGATVMQNVKVEIDEKTLKEIAKTSGGQYFRATSNKKLKAIYQEIDRLEKTKFQVSEYRKKHEAFLPWAIIGCIALFIGYLLDNSLLKRIA